MIELLDQAIQEHNPSHVFALFSGGHDSVCSTHIASQHPAFSGVIHCNTGIGIEATRVYVRETCKDYGWPLYEYHAREVNGRPIYEDMCLRLGMPGGLDAHNSQYHVLKKESIDRAVSEWKMDGRPIALVTGIRIQESSRRKRNKKVAVPMRLEGKKLWICPVLDWSAFDVNQYMAVNEIARNPVVDTLHRSGECLCGALAHHMELPEIEYWYPEVGQRIRALEKACFDRGLPWRWGGQSRLKMPPKEQTGFELCQSCVTKWDEYEAAPATVTP